MYMYEYVHKMDKIMGTPTLQKSYNNKNKATTNREATHIIHATVCSVINKDIDIIPTWYSFVNGNVNK